MIADKLKELEAARAKVLALEESIAADLRKELASLPARLGFETARAFVKAFRAATHSRRGRRRKSANSMKRARAVITDETREKVKRLATEGKTGAEIAKSLGISVPSVQNIKKAHGLVKSRKK